jgi:hypothetical protein
VQREAVALVVRPAGGEEDAEILLGAGVLGVLAGELA